ncbi:prolyl-tRNA synthetase [Patescibacteria group bacterium]|nr:MAG: prolyl-tRNA synthetase [Patescibacteria group bacterium]
MLQSQLFTKTRREAPSDEVTRNATLLIRGGFINKEMAGVYSFLPLGLRVLRKIEDIIREEMDKIGGQEVFLSSLQNPETWKKTKRWADEDTDIWLKTKSKFGGEYGLAFTHEEPLALLMTGHISSYRDLPVYIYQFQTKFRDEKRPKSGILRGREFVMKDLYSFCRNEAQHKAFYEKAKQAYEAIFNRAGIGERTFITFASGGSFSKYSHEFQTLADSGEDTIYLDVKRRIAVNKEVMTAEVLSDLKIKEKDLVEKKAIEVGNIFSLGTRFSEAFGLLYLDEKGEKHPVVMGSYGIGPGRLMGTIVEVFADERGIVWPEPVAPFDCHLIEISGSGTSVKKRAERIAAKLERGASVLYDDRDLRAGEKFADADLIGIPYQVIVSEKGEAGKTVEVKQRATGETKIISEEALISQGTYRAFNS